MNILVATISVLPKTASNYNYKIMLDGNEKGEISAMHTNESVVKAFAELGIKIDKIIALCSDKSLDERNVVFNQKTAFEYYKHCAQDLYSNISIVDVKIENRKNLKFSTKYAIILQPTTPYIWTSQEVNAQLQTSYNCLPKYYSTKA